MISIREAIDLVLAEVARLPAEAVPLPEADGRVLLETVRAPFDVPGFPNSQMDGFGVRAADVAGATADTPSVLQVVATVAAGRPYGAAVEPGTAVRIMTGAPVPAGVDAVIPIEDAETPETGRVSFRAPVEAGRFVRPAGEDMARGEVVLEAGRALRPADVGVLASIGVASVPVSRRPRVAILGTGDELVPLGEPLGPGQIHDSNAYTLAAAVREVGGEPHRFGIIEDRKETLREALRAGAEYDAVLSTGGVSVGDFDHVKDVMDEIGLRRRFWKVAQKPGKPITFASQEGCAYFGLPGNPVSAMVCFVLYVAPALRTALGRSDRFAPVVDVTIGERMPTVTDFTELVRSTFRKEEGRLVAVRTGSQSSGVLRSLSLADGLVLSDPGCSGFDAGDTARALDLRPVRDLARDHPFV